MTMKYWNEIEGSKLFNMVFSRNIPVGEIKLFALNMDNNLSILTLAFDIREMPDTPPKNWKSIGYNACRIGITCGEIRELTTSNIPTQKKLKFIHTTNWRQISDFSCIKHFESNIYHIIIKTART